MKKKSMGRPRKAPKGLTRVLFVRIDVALQDELEKLRHRKSSEVQGVTLSVADIVRAALWEAIKS